MSLLEVGVALVILVGLVGIIVPVLPGTVLVLGAILVWAIDIGGPTAWIVFAVCTVLLAVGTVVKYLVPGRRMKTAGVPGSTLALGAVGAVAGFFVIPVVGLLVGFVVGIYLAEVRRVGSAAAWPATVTALKAVGISILIELTAATAATLVWVGGVVAT